MDQIVSTKLTLEHQKYIFDAFGKHAISLTGINGFEQNAFSFELYEGEKLKGCLVIQIFWGQLHIKYLLIDENYRSQGYGRKLLEHAFDYAIKQGCKFSFVETMSFQAPEFYQKMGFEVDFKREGYDKQTSFYYLSKDLNKPLKIIPSITFKILDESDITLIVSCCTKQNYLKPVSVFEKYWQEQNKGERVICLAFMENHFAGYITLKWHSTYQPFVDQNIPVIMDLNVLPSYRKMGIGSKLLEWAESKAAIQSKRVGLGVGLYKGIDEGYGPAQRLYVKRGYIPDGNGLTYKGEIPEYGALLPLNDDLTLWLTKKLG